MKVHKIAMTNSTDNTCFLLLKDATCMLIYRWCTHSLGIVKMIEGLVLYSACYFQWFDNTQ